MYSFDEIKPTLYLVATPIGNLEDMSFRAIRILKEVDLIYAEDTRNSKILLDHFEIKTPYRSYHEFNQDIKDDEIVKEIKSGKNVAIISDAGMPVISDPGYKISKRAIAEDIPVVTIPGPSAFISALASSGISPNVFQFLGFLDSKKIARRKALFDIKYYSGTSIIYEAPHRIEETLLDISEIMGNRYIVIAREITKKFEEYIRGYVDELKNLTNLKGEMVIIISGYEDDLENKDVNFNQKIDELIAMGSKPNEAIKEVASIYKKDRKELYSSFLIYKGKKVV